MEENGIKNVGFAQPAPIPVPMAIGTIGITRELMLVEWQSNTTTRHLLRCLIACLTLTVAHGQTTNWLWGKGISGTGLDEGWSISTAPNGNSYITGFFASPTVTFGSTTLTNLGFHDVYLARYDVNGNVLWAKSAGGSHDDLSYAVSVDTNENIFVAGYFQSPTITFGSTTLVNSLSGSPDIFLAKYDSNGNVLWAISAGSSGMDIAKSISTDVNGNVYMTGLFMSPTITFGNYTLTNTGGMDEYLVKYDASGNVLWAQNPQCTFYDEGYSVATDTAGNAYVTGYFQNDPITFGNFTLTNTSSQDIFIVKYSPSGSVLWAKAVGGNDSDCGTSLTTDVTGNIYLTGYFQSQAITFGSFTLTNPNGNHDVFVVKYNSTGNVQWAKSAGGNAQDDAYSICANSMGNIFVTGGFYSPSILFGSITLTPPSPSVDPMFIVKYDSTGQVLCASALASGGDDNSGVSSDNLGNVYITGDFWISQFIIGSDTLLWGAPNAENIFIAKSMLNCGDVAVNEIDYKENISIFPNPFFTQTIFQTDRFFKNASLTVYNSLGQSIKHLYNLSGQTIVFHRDNLPSGLYFVQLTQDGNTIHGGKFVIADE